MHKLYLRPVLVTNGSMYVACQYVHQSKQFVCATTACMLQIRHEAVTELPMHMEISVNSYCHIYLLLLHTKCFFMNCNLKFTIMNKVYIAVHC